MNARQELADEVERHIRENCSKQFSLNELAESIHINKYHLLRTFKAVTGYTPLQYHNKCRCDKAEKLLAETDFSVSYIALETGFNSASHFSRVFSGIKGKTPTQFRAENQNII